MGPTVTKSHGLGDDQVINYDLEHGVSLEIKMKDSIGVWCDLTRFMSALSLEIYKTSKENLLESLL